MAHPIEVTDDTFDAEVINSDVPVLVDFWADWCAPCKMIAPIVDELANEYDGRIKFAKMDVDSNQRVPMAYGVRGIPTLLIFSGGDAVDQVVGAVPKGHPQEPPRQSSRLAPHARLRHSGSSPGAEQRTERQAGPPRTSNSTMEPGMATGA